MVGAVDWGWWGFVGWFANPPACRGANRLLGEGKKGFVFGVVVGEGWSIMLGGMVCCAFGSVGVWRVKSPPGLAGGLRRVGVDWYG